MDERELAMAQDIRRIGQEAFRARLLDAYSRRCAITGERTEPVLDAAHIQPYLGPRSNHIRNGVVLSKELHTFFDLGYVGSTPTTRFTCRRASTRSGTTGGATTSMTIGCLPSSPETRLRGQAALEWHLGRVFHE